MLIVNQMPTLFSFRYLLMMKCSIDAGVTLSDSIEISVCSPRNDCHYSLFGVKYYDSSDEIDRDNLSRVQHIDD